MLMAFEATYRLESITLAARELGLTQPAVSKSIKRLTEVYGKELFIRAPNSLKPNRTGKLLWEDVVKLLGICDNIVSDSEAEFNPYETPSKFTIATPMIDADYFFKHLVLDVMAEFPLIDIDVIHVPALEAYKHLEKDSIDAYIGYTSECLNKIIELEPILDIDFCIVCSDHSPLYNDGVISREDFINTPSLNIYKQFHELVLDEELKRCNLMQKEFKYVPNNEALTKFLSRSSALCLSTKRQANIICKKYPNTKILCPDFELPIMNLHLMWHKSNSTGIIHSWLLNLIRIRISESTY
jgi:DNA-binding transcriptional LysR family regulator